MTEVAEYADGRVVVHHGDCLEVLRSMPEGSIDACVTDPPYGLEFMGKDWDRFGPQNGSVAYRPDADSTAPVKSTFKDGVGTRIGAPKKNPRCKRCGKLGFDRPKSRCVCSTPDFDTRTREYAQDFQIWCQQWATECLRVLKPGGHLLAFGGTRTYHRLACAIEDAGFEIRDSIAWIHAQGFPKSLSPYRAIMGELCPSHESAPHAVRVSAWHPAASREGMAPTARALAETQPEGDLLLLTQTDVVGDSPEVTATLLSDYLTDGTSWNTVSSWRGYSADRWAPVSTSIIEMVSSTITDQRTSNCSASPNMRLAIAPYASRPDGCSCDVITVDESSNAGGPRSNVILIPTATASAIAPLAPLQGLGTAAKPAHEPIVVARKPLAGSVAANVLAYGTGALNVDGCRIETTDTLTGSGSPPLRYGGDNHRPFHDTAESRGVNQNPAGRWPTNLLLTHGDCSEDRCSPDCPVAEMDRQSGESVTPASVTRGGQRTGSSGLAALGRQDDVPCYGDSGGASRFFPVFKYEPKAPTSERPRTEKDGAGDGRVDNSARKVRECNVCGSRTKAAGGERNGPWPTCGHEDWSWVDWKPREASVAHPTVKPLDLMRWLVRLVTPPGGTCLDPFLGSGTTAEACVIEGFRCIGIEREAEYLPLIRARLNRRYDPEAFIRSTAAKVDGQGDLFCDSAG